MACWRHRRKNTDASIRTRIDEDQQGDARCGGATEVVDTLSLAVLHMALVDSVNNVGEAPAGMITMINESNYPEQHET